MYVVVVLGVVADGGSGLAGAVGVVALAVVGARLGSGLAGAVGAVAVGAVAFAVVPAGLVAGVAVVAVVLVAGLVVAVVGAVVVVGAAMTVLGGIATVSGSVGGGGELGWTGAATRGPWPLSGSNGFSRLHQTLWWNTSCWSMANLSTDSLDCSMWCQKFRPPSVSGGSPGSSGDT